MKKEKLGLVSLPVTGTVRSFGSNRNCLPKLPTLTVTRKLIQLSFVLSLLFSSWSSAGDFVADCDSRAANRDACLQWAQSSIKELGCTVTAATVDQACKIHPWGSDFVKSWICSVSAPDCDPFVHDQKTCPDGYEHLFKNGWDACKKKSGAQKFTGVCRHTMEVHTTVMPTCPESVSICGKMGGYREKLSVLCEKGDLREPMEVVGEAYACDDITKKCTAGGGRTFGEWKISCGFRDLKISRVESSCEALRSRCERGNSPKGAVGNLESCVLTVHQN